MTYTNVNVRMIRPLPHEFRHFLGPHIFFLTTRPSVHTKPNNSLTKTASFSKRSLDVCILDPHNGFANSCRRSKRDIFEFNSGPVLTKPVVSETGHVVTRILVDGVIQCFYRDFVHWGQQDSVNTNPVIFEIANIVTRIRVNGVLTVLLPGFRTLGSTGP